MFDPYHNMYANPVTGNKTHSFSNNFFYENI